MPNNKYIFNKLIEIYGDNYVNKIDVKGNLYILLKVHKYIYTKWYYKYYLNILY
jgi:hypothetical protein